MHQRTLSTKQQPTEWDKIFASQTPAKDLISRIYKELPQFKSKKTTQFLNGEMTKLSISPKKMYKWPIIT